MAQTYQETKARKRALVREVSAWVDSLRGGPERPCPHCRLVREADGVRIGSPQAHRFADRADEYALAFEMQTTRDLSRFEREACLAVSAGFHRLSAELRGKAA